MAVQNKIKLPSIVFIIPYFGKWPVWFEAHLVSIKANPTVDWLFYTDCDIPKEFPSNCTFVNTTLTEIEELFSRKIDLPIHIDKPYKLCDLKPSYGHVFEDQLKGYDFWGFTDIDIIWGDIRSKMSEELLSKYDIISSRNGFISGHFNLFRNSESVNTLYQKNGWYKDSFVNRKMNRFCEGTFTEITKEALKESIVTVKWDEILCNQERGRDSHQEYYLDKWLWKEGKMLEVKNDKAIGEVLYMHFINWKKTMVFSEILYHSNPDQFFISYTGVHYKKHSFLKKKFNILNNAIQGYYVKESIRVKKWKWNNFMKRLKQKSQKIFNVSFYTY